MQSVSAVLQNWLKRGIPVECYADLSKEDFEILPTEISLRRVADFLQGITAGDAGLGVHSRKRQIIIPRLEVCLLLLRQLRREPVDENYKRGDVKMK